jgi:hypothetical protein
MGNSGDNDLLRIDMGRWSKERSNDLDASEACPLAQEVAGQCQGRAKSQGRKA